MHGPVLSDDEQLDSANRQLADSLRAVGSKPPPGVAARWVPRKFKGLYRPSRYKVFHGGRGGAKSHTIADYLVQQGVERRMRWLCAREIQKSLSTSVHQLLVDKIVENRLQSAYEITREGIRGPHDTHFLFAGLRTNPDSVKSMEDLDGAWVEEANRCAQVSLDLLTPTVRKPGSELLFSFNRGKTTDPVDDLFLGGTPPPNSLVQQVNWRDNPWFPKVLYDEMMWMRGRDYDKYLHVWEGHPLKRTEAIVFHNWKEGDLDNQVPENAIPMFGADWGMRDPTVLVKAYLIGERTLYVAREAYKVGCTIDETPALFAGSDPRGLEDARWKNTFGHRGIEGAQSGRIIADSAYPQTIRYLNDRGFNVVPAKKGPGSIEEGIEFLQSFDIVVHPSCEHTMEELGYYAYKVDKHTDEVLPELEDKDNHVIDSLRYAAESARRAQRSRVSVHAPELIHQG